MADHGVRKMNERLLANPSLGLNRDDDVFEEEAAAGGVSGLVNRCEGLSLAGGIEGGGFNLPTGGGGRGGGLVDGPGGIQGAGLGLQGGGGPVLLQGIYVTVLLRAGGRSESGLVRLGLLANMVVGARDGQGMGLEQLGVMGGGFATHGGGGNGGGDRVQAVKGGIAVAVKGGIAGSGEGHGEGSGVGMGGMNNDGGGVLDGIGVVGGRVVVGGIARIVGRHGEGGRLDARWVVNDGGGGGGYLGVNSVWKLLVLLLVVDEGYNPFVRPHE